MFTSSSFYSCHLRGSIHPARLRLELCFLSTSAGEDFPRRASHPSPLHIYPNSSAAAAPPPSRPSFGASQASFISASCLFCSRFHTFTANSLTAQTSRPAFVLNPQNLTFVADIPSLRLQRSFSHQVLTPAFAPHLQGSRPRSPTSRIGRWRPAAAWCRAPCRSCRTPPRSRTSWGRRS